jgi:GT2 family glycosyltransferase
VVMVYGDCRYIDQGGNELFINRSGEVARKLLGYGPQLIPQPGALWRRDAFEAVGGLSADFDLAFDYDLFMKLKREGTIAYIPQILASFRWHPDSLSVKSRWKSAKEASRVRIRHHRGFSKLLIALEPAIVLATWMAGKLVTRFRLSPSRSNQSI